jgi:phosphatidylinositol alpha-1,6-mannosyltransferase
MIIVNEFPPGPGGVGTHAYELARHLEIIGHSIIVVCSQNYSSEQAIDNFNKDLRFTLIDHEKQPNYVFTILSRLSLIFRTIRTHKPDVVIASGSNSIWVGAIFRYLLRSFKLVVVAHGGELTFSSNIRRSLTRLGCRLADHIISVSNYTKQYIPDKLPSKITVIHNGANHFLLKDKNLQEELKYKYGYSDKHILLTVGSVSERKGQDIVMKALRTVIQQYPDTIYLMAGRSNNIEFFQALARQEGVENNVVFLGSVDNEYLVDLYNMTDLYVIASRHSSDGDFEGFGISVIEAALCSVPAVVTRDSGLLEAIEEGVTGFSVPSENPGELAKAIIHLMDDSLRINMGIAARNRAEQNFTWVKVALSYHKVLTSL